MSPFEAFMSNGSPTATIYGTKCGVCGYESFNGITTLFGFSPYPITLPVETVRKMCAQSICSQCDALGTALYQLEPTELESNQ